MCTCTSYQSRGKFINSSYIIKFTRNEQPGNLHQVKDNENKQYKYRNAFYLLYTCRIYTWIYIHKLNYVSWYMYNAVAVLTILDTGITNYDLFSL